MSIAARRLLFPRSQVQAGALCANPLHERLNRFRGRMLAESWLIPRTTNRTNDTRRRIIRAKLWSHPVDWRLFPLM
jgi:hypothetical protein